tara:strand:+ start:786 stop:1067 length:282 start_codon:yes stop_codon:yes gene_type:complete
MSQKTFFPNGYGVSILSSEFSYGLEMAVLKGTKENHDICYDTPITNDVLGHLDSEGLDEAVQAVKDLPSVTIEEEEDKPSKTSLPYRGEFIGE